MMIRFYEGKLAQINGKLDVAQKCFEPRESDEQSFKVKVDMILNLNTFKEKNKNKNRPFQKCACYWEAYWCHLLQGNFPQAAEAAQKLLKSSTWSPAVFTYLRAIALVRVSFLSNV